MKAAAAGESGRPSLRVIPVGTNETTATSSIGKPTATQPLTPKRPGARAPTIDFVGYAREQTEDQASVLREHRYAVGTVPASVADSDEKLNAKVGPKLVQDLHSRRLAELDPFGSARQTAVLCNRKSGPQML